MGKKKGWFKEYDLASYADTDLFQPFRKSAIAKAQKTGTGWASRLLRKH